MPAARLYLPAARLGSTPYPALPTQGEPHGSPLHRCSYLVPSGCSLLSLALETGYRSVFHNVPPTLNFPTLLGNWEPHFTRRHPHIGNLSLGRHTGDGKSDGETFLNRTWMFFLRGTGGEEKAPGHGQQGRSLDDVLFQTDTFCYILYVEQWGFRCYMPSGHREGGPRSSITLGRHVRCSVSTTRRPSPHIEDGEGTVAPRSDTDSTEQWV